MHTPPRRLLVVAIGLLITFGACGAPASAPAASPAGGAVAAAAAPANTTAPSSPTAASAGGASPPAALLAVKTGVTGTDPPNGVLVAAERGYFAEVGLDVDWQRIGVSAEVMRT